MLWLRRVLTGDGRQASFNKERDIPRAGAMPSIPQFG
jgi:hypothetical protein